MGTITPMLIAKRYADIGVEACLAVPQYSQNNIADGTFALHFSQRSLIDGYTSLLSLAE